VFKPLQVFLFSLIPLALVFAGVIIGSMHGIDSEKEVFPTAVPTTPGTGPPVGDNVLVVSAQNIKFDKGSLQAKPRTEVIVHFTNNDAGVLHNVAFYTNRQARTKIFVGEIITGVATSEEKFTTPAAGTYFFRCDVHPDQMTGSFIVK
jgi:plastocyanin